MSSLGVWKRLWAVLAVGITIAAAAQAQTFSSLFSFDASDGSFPYSSPAQGVDGGLYGTATEGGDFYCDPNGCGTIFGVSLEGKLSMLHALKSNEGAAPDAGLLLATNGSFYGTTAVGTVFTITRAGKLTVLDSLCPQFPNCPNGDGLSGLIQSSDGNFYGTAYYGGNGMHGWCSPAGQPGCGTIFRVTPDGTVNKIYDFCSENSCSDGANPNANLVEGSDGYLYGVTTIGGTSPNCSPYGCGTIFKIAPDRTFVTLHSFNGNDGSSPAGALTEGWDGNFYGTTTNGGSPACIYSSGCGTVFKISRSGVFSTLYSFCSQSSCPDGSLPDLGVNGLVLATDGGFYGVTLYGGANNAGTIFRITPSGKLTTVHSFNGTDGKTPWAAPIQATNGILYGTTGSGGANKCACGTIYTLNMELPPFVTFVRAEGKVGQTSGILGQGFTGTRSVMFNGIPANFTVVSATFIKATVPAGATTGYVSVTTPTGTLKSNVPFHVIP